MIPVPAFTLCLKGNQMIKHQEGGPGVLVGANTKWRQEGESRGFALRAASNCHGCTATLAWVAQAALRMRKRVLSSLCVREVTLGKVASVTALGLAICSFGSKPIF